MATQNTDGYKLEVNEVVINLQDPMPTANQILQTAGFVPADEHILIQLLKGSSNALGLDESVDLSKAESMRFRAFRSDRTFRFTLDGVGCEWGQGTISESELRKVAEVEDNKALVREHQNEPDRTLNQNDQITLTDVGTEHIRTTSKAITVVIDEIKTQIDCGSHTTEQLTKILDIQPGYLLNVLVDGQFKPLNPGECFTVKENMKFISQVPCGGSA